MVSLLYKWFLLLPVLLNPTWNPPALSAHPIFVSVTEIEHNRSEKSLEISCKLFTDDFEQTLRLYHPGKIDLLNTNQKEAAGKMIAAYIQQHLVITADGEKTTLQFLGFEQQEEGIISYFQVSNISSIKKLSVFNNLLYESKPQQMGIVHATVNGIRKSSRLNNPDARLELTW